MKQTLSAALLLLMITACGVKDDVDSGGGGEESDDVATAESIWSEISGYETWSQADPWIGVQPSSDNTHGSHVQVWLSDAASGTLGGTIADGGILVKEGYDSADGAATAVVIMKKIEGYDPDNGDWFWARYSTDGAVQDAGALSSCYGCHASGVDYSRIATDVPGGR